MMIKRLRVIHWVVKTFRRTIEYMPRVKVVTHDWRRVSTYTDTRVAVTIPTRLWYNLNNPHPIPEDEVTKYENPQRFYGTEPLWYVSGLLRFHLYPKMVWKTMNQIEVSDQKSDTEVLRSLSEVLKENSEDLRLKVLKFQLLKDLTCSKFWQSKIILS